MRLAAKRLVWIPAAVAGLAAVSASGAGWIADLSEPRVFAAIVLSRVLASLLFRLDRLYWRDLTFRDAITAVAACAGGSAIAAATAVLLPVVWPARLLAAELALHSALAMGLTALVRLREARWGRRDPHAIRTLIWGAGARGRSLLEDVRRAHPFVDILGWLDDDPVLAEIDRDGLPVLGPIESLPLLVEVHGVQAVIAAIPDLSRERRALAEDLARWSGVKLIFTPGYTASLQALASQAPQPAASATSIPTS